jgi:hypothetical protein
MRQNAGLLLIAADMQACGGPILLHSESVGPGRAAVLFQLGPRLCCFCASAAASSRLPGAAAFASTGSDPTPEKLGTYLSAFSPNHFVCGFFAREAQDKLVGYFKIM